MHCNTRSWGSRRQNAAQKNFLISYLLCGPAVRLHDFTTYLSCSEILCINPYFTETASGPCKMFFVRLMLFL